MKLDNVIVSVLNRQVIGIPILQETGSERGYYKVSLPQAGCLIQPPSAEISPPFTCWFSKSRMFLVGSASQQKGLLPPSVFFTLAAPWLIWQPRQQLCLLHENEVAVLIFLRVIDFLCFLSRVFHY